MDAREQGAIAPFAAGGPGTERTAQYLAVCFEPCQRPFDASLRQTQSLREARCRSRTDHAHPAPYDLEKGVVRIRWLSRADDGRWLGRELNRGNPCSDPGRALGGNQG